MCTSCYPESWMESYEQEAAEKEARLLKVDKLREAIIEYHSRMTRTKDAYHREALPPVQGPATTPLYSVNDTVVVSGHTTYRATVTSREWSGMKWWYGTTTGVRSDSIMASVPECNIRAAAPVEAVTWNRTARPENVWA